MRVPTATYRLQFGTELGFRRARRFVPYLHALGVSDVYASPLLASRPGTSGYHVVDPTRLDPGLGTRAEFDRLTDDLRSRGMGLVLDIVPNHMAATSDNPWWMDVLRRGQSSRYAQFFDIDWSRHEGKVFVPVLDAPLPDVLREGGLSLGRHGAGHVLRYHDHVFPVHPMKRGRWEIEDVVARQHYVLGSWRDAGREVNYRRFFDISDLVAVRQEVPGVFDATHALVLELVREGRVTGLRIDHVDGLRDPLGYLRRLRRAVGDDVPIWVEKILARGEDLPASWPVQGTTGYEFATAATEALMDGRGAEELRRIAGAFTERHEPFREIAAATKRQVVRELFSGQIRALVTELASVLGRESRGEEALSTALVEVTARLRVYRTYVRGRGISPADRAVVTHAVRDARRYLEGGAWSALDSIRDVLLLRRGGRRGIEFVLKWQQFTSAVAAKGIEDTALYADVAFVARNDVGSEPDEPAGGAEAFHRLARARARRWPRALSATSTHDSKRSEDTRARIAVLSEVPGRWGRALRAWTTLAAPLKRTVGGESVPDAAEELLLYQTLLGVMSPGPEDDEGLAGRVESYALKAVREAKVRSSWIDPDLEREEALVSFVRSLFGPEGAELRGAMATFLTRLSPAGAANALAQALWKTTAPGVPDVYQGTERWFLRLVDPDNRSPARLESAQETLRSLPDADVSGIRVLSSSWQDGRIKLHVLRTGLNLRRSDPDLFERGSYVPIEARGTRSRHVLGFARRRGGRWAVTLTVRRGASMRAKRFPVGTVWHDTSLVLPNAAPSEWRDLLTGTKRRAESRELLLREVFADLPLALLVPHD